VLIIYKSSKVVYYPVFDSKNRCNGLK